MPWTSTGGAILDADGNAANLDLGQHAITDDPDVRVDGSRSHEPGTVERVGVSSSPQNGQSYGAGEDHPRGIRVQP